MIEFFMQITPRKYVERVNELMRKSTFIEITLIGPYRVDPENETTCETTSISPRRFSLSKNSAPECVRMCTRLDLIFISVYSHVADTDFAESRVSNYLHSKVFRHRCSNDVLVMPGKQFFACGSLLRLQEARLRFFNRPSKFENQLINYLVN